MAWTVRVSLGSMLAIPRWGLAQTNAGTIDSSAIVFPNGNVEGYNIGGAARSASEAGGVRINLISREGSNNLTASFIGSDVSPDLLTRNNTGDLKARGLTGASRLKSVWSLNPIFGGIPMEEQR